MEREKLARRMMERAAKEEERATADSESRKLRGGSTISTPGRLLSKRNNSNSIKKPYEPALNSGVIPVHHDHHPNAVPAGDTAPRITSTSDQESQKMSEQVRVQRPILVPLILAPSSN